MCVTVNCKTIAYRLYRHMLPMTMQEVAFGCMKSSESENASELLVWLICVFYCVDVKKYDGYG